jgi:hypothetical protein
MWKVSCAIFMKEASVPYPERLILIDKGHKLFDSSFASFKEWYENGFMRGYCTKIFIASNKPTGF